MPGSPALPGTVPPSLQKKNPEELPFFGWGVTSQMPARVLSSVARHWRDTGLGVARLAAVRLCAQNPCGTVLVWHSLVFVLFCFDRFWLHFYLEEIADFDFRL
jgi:hypothetical protein